MNSCTLCGNASHSRSKCPWGRGLSEAVELPPLPTPAFPAIDTADGNDKFTATQMRDYARAAIATHPKGDALTDEQISSLWDGHIVPVFGKNGINPIVFARAVIAADRALQASVPAQPVSAHVQTPVHRMGDTNG